MAITLRKDGSLVFDSQTDLLRHLDAEIARQRKGEGSPYDTGPAPTITAREDSYAVEQDGTELGTTDGVWPEALRLVEGTEWFADAVARKKPDELSGGKLAPGRWFDAARDEALPATQGGQLSKENIDEIVRNLAGMKRAVIIDGGDLASTPHGSVEDPTNTPASGYVLAGVRVTEKDGGWHLWLYCRLHTDVDTKVNDREYVYGSVAWIDDARHPYTDDELGSRLLSYALTSEPLQDDLTPHPVSEGEGEPAEGERTGLTASLGPEKYRQTLRRLAAGLPLLAEWADAHVTARARTAIKPGRLTVRFNKPTTEHDLGNRRESMTTKKKTKRPERGVAMDALKKLGEMLSVDLSELDQEKIWQLTDKVYAVAQAAQGEAVVESLGGGGGEEAPAEKKTETPPEPQPRAVDGLDGDALEAWVAAVLGWARDVFGAPDADPAAVLDLMAAATDAVKGAIGGEKPPENAADGGQAQGDEGARTAKAEAFAKRKQELADAKELAEHRAAKQTRDIDDLIDKKWRAAEIALPKDADRAELHELCAGAKDPGRLLDIALRGVNRPPAGLKSTPDGDTPRGGAPLTEDDAFEAAKARALKANPALRGADLYQAAKLQMQTGLAG